MGPMGGPMDFGRNKSKFQEVPETGVTFDDVAVPPCLSVHSAVVCRDGIVHVRAACNLHGANLESWVGFSALCSCSQRVQGRERV